MRVSPDVYTSVNSAIQQSEQTLQTALNQLSSGKRVALPSNDPLAFSQDLQSLATSATVDTYTQNSDSVLALAQQADSTLSSVVTSLTQAISIGTQSGGPTITPSQRTALAQQFQTLISDVASQANLGVNGTALFAGTSGSVTPFVADPSAPNGYTYTGDSGVNKATVGDTLQVAVNVPGDAVFTSPDGNVFLSLQQMSAAIQSGSSVGLAAANVALTAAIAHVGQVRAAYGSTVNQLQAQNNFLSQETVSLSSAQNALVGVDTATAATNLSQAETNNSAVLAAAAKVLPLSLLTYLH